MDLNHHVQELVHLKPALRKDVSISINSEGDERVYIIEDVIRGKYYRIGEPEYRLLVLLDGAKTVGEALVEVAQGLGRDALTESEASLILNWAFDTHLLESETSVSPDAIVESRLKKKDRQFLKWTNPLFVKLPLCNPDSFLRIISPITRLIVNPFAFLIWVGVVVAGLFQIFSHMDRFSADAAGILSVSNWWSLLIIWALLKVVHELFHGMVCKHYGGYVGEAGVIMILLAPIGYVNATTSWKFESRWHRMFTAAAGMYVEFFIAGVAAFFWATAEPGLVRDICYNIIIIASINTLLFNANPLMKFDGYYIFSDLVNIPNLYVEGAAYVKYLARRYLLGVPTQFPERSTKESVIIKIYGVLSVIWRFLIVITLIILATALFNGFGALLALFAAGTLILFPLMKFLRYLFAGNDREKPQVLRFVVVLVTIAGVLYGSLFELRWEQSVPVNGLVEVPDLKEYRTRYPAIVAEVFVNDGALVDAGDPLLRLENPELEVKIAQQQAELKKIDIERKRLLSEQKVGELQALIKREEALQTQITDGLRSIDDLLITAEAPGQVVMQGEGYLLGRFVSNTDVLVSVAGMEKRAFHLAIPEREFNRLDVEIADQLDIFLPGRAVFTASVTEISPTASNAVLYPSLTALGGGAIPVLQSDSNEFKTAQGYFWVTSDIQGPDRVRLGAGERGMSTLRGEPVSLGFLWTRSVKDWAKGLTKSMKS
ncbi:MAG: biotin/lipoyl-binding protein [Acidiferrobacterales bacterium]|nr:biotin/lipoyl-binding protein [Acidiferrobacterales bacterium]